jgi:hypothetical protein
MKNADYHGAANRWLSRHSNKTVFCLVQFKDTSVETLPRMYLATPQEIADWLKKAAAGRGDTILCEKHTWSKRAHATGTTDVISESWKFTERRLEEIVQKTEQASLPNAQRPARR